MADPAVLRGAPTSLSNLCREEHRRILMSERSDGALLLTLFPRPGTRQTRTVRDLKDLEKLVRRARPDEVMLDLHLPIRSGLNLLRTLSTACPDARVLARVHSRIGDSQLYSVSLEGTRLSLRPLGPSGSGIEDRAS